MPAMSHEYASGEPTMSDNDHAAEIIHEQNARHVFLRDALVFHTKLMLDGFRDVILFPVSLLAVLYDFVKRDGPPGRHFYEVMHFARETEHWINLFEAARRVPETDEARPVIDGPSFDEFVDHIEMKLKSGHEEGDLSEKAKETFGQIIAAARKTMERSARSA